MYNSVVVGGLVKIWNLFSNSYGESLLKKIIDKPKNFFSYLFKYSRIGHILTSKDSLILKSTFYKICNNVFLFVDRLFKSIYKFVTDKSNGSLVYKNINSLFKDNREVIKTISIFVVSIFIGIILNSIFIFNMDSKEKYIISLVFIIIGALIAKLSSNYKDILDNSFIWRFISSLFMIDEGGDKWW